MDQHNRPFVLAGKIALPNDRRLPADDSETRIQRIPAMHNPFRAIVKADDLSPALAATLFVPEASAVPSINIRTIGELVSNRESFHAAKKVHRSTHSPGTRGLSRDGPKAQRQQ